MSTVMFPKRMHWPPDCHSIVLMTRSIEGLVGHVITCLQNDDLDDLFINQTLIKNSTMYRCEQPY